MYQQNIKPTFDNICTQTERIRRQRAVYQKTLLHRFTGHGVETRGVRWNWDPMGRDRNPLPAVSQI